MARLEYPQVLYVDGDVSKDARRVENPEERAAAEADGFQALEHPPEAVVEAAAQTVLDHPRYLYLDGDVTKDSVLVKNADEEAARAEDGYRRLAGVGPPPADEKPKGKKKPKA